MDPICEKKINFLQKYVPFLGDLIGRLTNVNGKEGKLAQMQLLYDLLNKPDISVKIETLEMCERVLGRVFGNANENDVEINEASKEDIVNRFELPEKIDGNGEQSHIEAVEKGCKNINGCSEDPSCATIVKPSDTDAAITSENPPLQENPPDELEAKECIKESKVKSEPTTTTFDKYEREPLTTYTNKSESKTESARTDTAKSEAITEPTTMETVQSAATTEQTRTETEKSDSKTERTTTETAEFESKTDKSDAETEPITMEVDKSDTKTEPTTAEGAKFEAITEPTMEIAKSEAETEPITTETDKSDDKTELIEETDKSEAKTEPTTTETIKFKAETEPITTETEKSDDKTELIEETDKSEAKTEPTTTETIEFEVETAPITTQTDKSDDKTELIEETDKSEAKTEPTITETIEFEAITEPTTTEIANTEPTITKTIEFEAETEPITTETDKSDDKTELIEETDKSEAKTEPTTIDSIEFEAKTEPITLEADNSDAKTEPTTTQTLKPAAKPEPTPETDRSEAKTEVAVLEICPSGEDKSNFKTNEITSEIKAKKTEKANLASEGVLGNDTSKTGVFDINQTNDELREDNGLLVEMNASIHEEKNIENSCLTEDGNSQVDESDIFILPDDGESLKPVADGSKSEDKDAVEEPKNCDEREQKNMAGSEPEEQQTDVIRQSETEMLQFKIISAESLAIQSVQSLSENDKLNLLKPVETEKINENISDGSENHANSSAKNRSHNNDDMDPLDPLNYPPENLSEIVTAVPVENGSINSNHTNNEKDDDDDDVLLIETRSSPICIDSDPEDEENMKQNCSLPIMPSERTITKSQEKQKRTSARKSTSGVIDTIRHIIKQHVSIKKVPSHKKSKSQVDYLLKKDPKALMETINLIDSDSDEENSKKVQKTKADDDDVVIISSTQPRRSIFPIKQQAGKQTARFPPRLVNKQAAKPATAQSHFLNAVNLQPAPKSNSNPASFSAQLSNKKVIIPNAFYGNPTYNRKPAPSSAVVVSQDESSSNDSVLRSSGSASTVSISQVQDRMLKEWLEGFLTNFASPLQLASHACFVLLQRVLKYRFFQRLKETRVNLNTLAKNFVPETMDVQMLLDLRNVFLENGNLTEAGRRFCRFATNDAFGKPVALTTDSRTGKVTCRTRIGSKTDVPIEALKAVKASIPEKTPSVPQVPPANTTNATVTSASPASSISAAHVSHKRKPKLRKLSDGLVVAVCDTEDNDYTPYMGELVPENEVVTERKKSLRTNRTKRKEAGFTYSEDHDDEEFEALAKKIEDKKREELRLAEEKELEQEREAERKTKKTVAKKTTSKRQGSAVIAQMDIPKEPTRKRLRLANTEILGNADDDLLTPMWVESDGDDGEVDSLLDFADEPQSPEANVSDNDKNAVGNYPTGAAEQDSDDSDSYPQSFDVGTNKLLKNTDRGLHGQSQSFDFCVHCLRRVSRTVHHYVNEHRSSEVFTSRLRNKDVRRLLTTSNVGFVNLYKGNQQQYAAHCIFCDKEAKFLLPYWFEHFTMHTGEYSFKCSGCHILKPTRSLLTNHFQSGAGCPKKGTTVRLHTFDTKCNQIEAHICAICNYIQMHRKNVLRHLKTQHDIETISANHIIRVVLLQVSGPYRDQESISNDESQLLLLQHSDEEGNDDKDAPMTLYDENSLMMQNDFTDNDDLSFMICGMLDVQMNLSATGGLQGNVNTKNLDK